MIKSVLGSVLHCTLSFYARRKPESHYSNFPNNTNMQKAIYHMMCSVICILQLCRYNTNTAVVYFILIYLQTGLIWLRIAVQFMLLATHSAQQPPDVNPNGISLLFCQYNTISLWEDTEASFICLHLLYGQSSPAMLQFTPKILETPPPLPFFLPSFHYFSAENMVSKHG